MAVPHELSAIARRRVSNHPCALCPEKIGGRRAVLGACWVAHLDCYRAAFDVAAKQVPALTVHGKAKGHQLFREVITRRVAAAHVTAQLAAIAAAPPKPAT